VLIRLDAQCHELQAYVRKGKRESEVV